MSVLRALSQLRLLAMLWVMSTVSCPQSLMQCLQTHACGFFYEVRPIFVSLFSYCLLFFLALLSFPKSPAFSWCTWSRTTSVLSFCFQWYFRLNLLSDPLAHLSGSPGYLYSSPLTPYLKWIRFFLLDFFSVQLLYPYIVIGNTRYGWP